jgi:peroxiredoxin
MKRLSFLLLLGASLLYSAGELSHRRAPGFSIVDAAQQQHDLADYRGKYVIVDFMQTKCTHCITFAEIIEKLMIKYLDSVKAYIKDHNITVPVVFDCGQVTASYLKLGPSTPKVYFPHVFIVDPEGTIVNDWIYTMGTENIFEGDGFIKEIDKLMAAHK